MRHLFATLQHVYAQLGARPARFDPAWGVYGGLETRRVPREYFWDGTKRGGDPAHPYFVFQYTLEGWGCYTQGPAVQKVMPGMAFTAIIPSAHRYYLPEGAGPWSFFWLMVRHPYLVQRVIVRQKAAGAVWAIPPDSLLVAAAVRLFAGICQNSFRDEFALEQSLFDFLIEYERFGHGLVYSPQERDRLLSEARGVVLAHLGQPVGVWELARMKGMSRSNFSHHFKSVTGLSPARFVTEVRLQEVVRRLLHTRDTLKAIASDSGFADANHLCKVFRRFHHLSPGEFRRQMK